MSVFLDFLRQWARLFAKSPQMRWRTWPRLKFTPRFLLSDARFAWHTRHNVELRRGARQPGGWSAAGMTPQERKAVLEMVALASDHYAATMGSGAHFREPRLDAPLLDPNTLRRFVPLLRRTPLVRSGPIRRRRSPNDPLPSLRAYVAARDGHRCVLQALGLPHECSPWLGMGCGHVIPRARGGRSIASNLVWECNVGNEEQVKHQDAWAPKLRAYLARVEPVA